MLVPCMYFEEKGQICSLKVFFRCPQRESVITMFMCTLFVHAHNVRGKDAHMKSSVVLHNDQKMSGLSLSRENEQLCGFILLAQLSDSFLRSFELPLVSYAPFTPRYRVS